MERSRIELLYICMYVCIYIYGHCPQMVGPFKGAEHTHIYIYTYSCVTGHRIGLYNQSPPTVPVDSEGWQGKNMWCYLVLSGILRWGRSQSTSWPQLSGMCVGVCSSYLAIELFSQLPNWQFFYQCRCRFWHLIWFPSYFICIYK